MPPPSDDDDDKTPVERPSEVRTAICPFCRRRRVVTVAGLFELHTITGKWAKAVCRGSGARVLHHG